MGRRRRRAHRCDRGSRRPVPPERQAASPDSCGSTIPRRPVLLGQRLAQARPALIARQAGAASGRTVRTLWMACRASTRAWLGTPVSMVCVVRAFQREGEQLRSENTGVRDPLYIAAPVRPSLMRTGAPPAAPFAAWVRHGLRDRGRAWGGIVRSFYDIVIDLGLAVRRQGYDRRCRTQHRGLSRRF
jgi:hypothetical protein